MQISGSLRACVKSLSDVASPAVGRSNSLFLGRVDPPGWSYKEGPGLEGLTMAAALISWLGSPCSTQKGGEINGTPTLLRPVLLFIQPDGMYLTDYCTMFIVADFNHLHAHQFLR